MPRNEEADATYLAFKALPEMVRHCHVERGVRMRSTTWSRVPAKNRSRSSGRSSAPKGR